MLLGIIHYRICQPGCALTWSHDRCGAIWHAYSMSLEISQALLYLLINPLGKNRNLVDVNSTLIPNWTYAPKGSKWTPAVPSPKMTSISWDRLWKLQGQLEEWELWGELRGHFIVTTSLLGFVSKLFGLKRLLKALRGPNRPYELYFYLLYRHGKNNIAYILLLYCCHQLWCVVLGTGFEFLSKKLTTLLLMG